MQKLKTKKKFKKQINNNSKNIIQNNKNKKINETNYKKYLI